MKHIKRFGAIFLSLAMVVMMLPVFATTVFADGTLEVSDPKLGLSYTTPGSGSASWTADGNSITGKATGYKFIVNLAASTKLTITNNYSDTRILSFSYSLTGGGSVSGIISSTSGTYSGELAGGKSATITLKSPSGASTNTLKITDIKLIGSSNITATFLPAENGSYTVNGTAVTSEVSYTKASDESSYTLKATPASGYSLYGWYDELSGEYLSYNAEETIFIGSNATVKPVFVAGNPAHYGVGDNRYVDFDAAIAAAQSGSNKTVVVLKDGELSGTHTIPSGVTLLIPYNSGNTAYGSDPGCTTGSIGSAVKWVQPTVYRTLTLAADAHLTVNGNIEVGGQYSTGNGTTGYYCASTGPLGHIKMQAGSHIDVNSGANIYAWGYIYGDGTVTAKSGAKLHEIFQMTDFRGGNVTTTLAGDKLVFPTSQYYVQNIEVATCYDYGATEVVYGAVQMNSICSEFNVNFIGANAMFQPTENSYFIKQYVPEEDRLHVEAYGSCRLSSLAMKIQLVSVDSKDYVLPINSNIDITIKTGTATLDQNVMMLPGSSLTVDEGAVLKISNKAYTDSTRPGVMSGDGYIVQLFDSSNWTQAYKLNDSDMFELVENVNMVHPATKLGPAGYSPSPNRKVRTVADLTDVTMDINGTVVCDGYMYSTVTYADLNEGDLTIVDGGANVISSKGTGKLQMVNGAGEETLGTMYDQSKSTYVYVPMASVQLTNGDGSMLDTTGAEAGTVYVYCTVHDCWCVTACELCDPCAAGHSHQGEQTKAPTCTAAGEMTYTCSVCGDTYTESISALGHTAGAAADCVNAQTCTVCGAQLAAALGHSYEGVQTLAPTCGAEGVTTHTCSACGDSYTTAIPATGAHTYDNEFDVDCNGCGGIREVELPIVNDGKSVSDDVSGLAFKFTMAAIGMEVDKTTAIYDGATINGYKLLEMGATVSNDQSNIKLKAVYLFALEKDSATFAVRVINIPEANYDSEITAVPYFVVEIGGEAVTIEGEAVTATYNGVLNN